MEITLQLDVEARMVFSLKCLWTSNKRIKLQEVVII